MVARRGPREPNVMLMCLCVAWQQFSPVADLFVFSAVVLNISTAVILFGTRPTASYLRPNPSRSTKALPPE